LHDLLHCAFGQSGPSGLRAKTGAARARLRKEVGVADTKEIEPKKRRGMPPSDKPTLKTIAEMTGLAVTTISRALNNAPELAQETRERVQRIAAEIGYLPDRTALRLKTGRTNVITVVMSPDEGLLGYGSALLSGLAASIRTTSYHLVVTPHFGNTPKMEPIRHVVRNRLADGVVFSRTEPHDERVRFLLDQNFPFVTHGRTDWPEAHPFVDFDNAAFAREAVRRLAKKGRKRLAIILPEPELTYTRFLREGFLQAAAELGVATEIPTEIDLGTPPDAQREFILAQHQRGNAPDGYVCCSEVSAIAVIAGLTDSGATLGETVDVIAKQATPLFNNFRPRIETVFEDFALAGEQLGRMLQRRIAGEAPEGLQFVDVPEVRWDE
jgi:LacI family transcriptional regulator